MTNISNDTLIIGLTGSFGSGVSEIANLLSDEGFRVLKVSDFLKAEATKLGTPISRHSLQLIGNNLRKNDIEKDGGDGGYLIRKAIDVLQKEDNSKYKGIALESIKNPGEINELRKYPNAFLVAIDAPESIRWGRLKHLPEYKSGQQAFTGDDQRDKKEDLYCTQNKTGNKLLFGQEVTICVDLADVLINNIGKITDKEEFKRNILNILGPIINGPGTREPTQHELFMSQAYNTSLMSPCLKRQVGAIIVKIDKGSKRAYLISSGYNKAPRGNIDCIKGSCRRDERKRKISEILQYCPKCGHKFGSAYICPNQECQYSKKEHKIKDDITLSRGLDICPAVHAEEQSILQAAYLGSASLEDAILYSTTFPCLMCAKMIIQVGIKKIFFIDPYPDKYSRDTLINAEIELEKFEGIKAQAYYKSFKRNIDN
ncbi:MAG: deaminase [Patescibacteria group bacterium]